MTSLGGQRDPDAATVLDRAAAFHEAALLEAVEAVRHGAGRDLGRVAQLLGGQPATTHAAQRRQHVEFPRCEAGRRQRPLEPVGQDAREDLDAQHDTHAGRVQVRPLATPLGEHLVNGVAIRGHA
jgi:hypothetical protein